MLIGEVGRRTGVSPKTLRFYEREGLLPEPSRTPSNYRDYDPQAVERVTFIKEAQGAGFTLAQIREIFNVRDSGQPPCKHVESLVEHRLTDIERRMRELRKLRSQLHGIAKRARTFDPEDCEGYCGLIA